MTLAQFAEQWPYRVSRHVKGAMSSAMISCLDGTLIRSADGSWCWLDGTPEPRVRDLPPSWNFRCRSDGNGVTQVEVLAGIARETDALAWVIDGASAGRYQQGDSGDHTGPLVWDGVSMRRSHIRPGEDPLHGAEPLDEVPGPIPRVILVPIAEWDAWAHAHPEGAVWDPRDESAILTLALSHGWSPPAGYVSPAGWRAE